MAREDEVRLFVYGSLRRGDPSRARESLLRDAETMGSASTAGRLMDCGAWPGLVEGVDPGDRVHGELVSLRRECAASCLRALDGYEGADRTPPLFRRERRAVRRADGCEIQAWVYVLGSVPPGARVVPGGDWTAWAGPSTPP